MSEALSPSVPTTLSATPHTIGLAARLARRAVLVRLRGLAHGGIEIREPGGVELLGRRDDGPCPVVTISDPATWTAVATAGTVGAGGAWIEGQWTCDDLPALIHVFLRNRAQLDGLEGGWARLGGAALRLWHLLRPNTRAGSRRNIAAHYDLGNELFALFLDPTLMYSSAFFATSQTSLDAAAVAKCDRLCALLELSPSDHLLEIGTGWGGFAIHAARTTGCRVTTTTISQRQHDLASARVRAAGLADRVQVLLSDYRDLHGSYDKLVSIEMIEAIGHRAYPTFFATCGGLLKAHGLMAVQTITIAERQYAIARRSVDFIQRHVFPGSCIPSLSALGTAMAQSSDLEVVRVDDIGAHYARTLDAWRGRFLARLGEVRALGYDEGFIRLWDYYLAYCSAGFAQRALGCAQILYAKPGWRARPSVT